MSRKQEYREEWRNDNDRLLAYRAIDEFRMPVRETVGGESQVKMFLLSSGARWVIKYVLACEIYGEDIIRPSLNYLVEKYNRETGGRASKRTMQNWIAEAKRSQFITTTGTRASKIFELNINFLKERMGEVLGREKVKLAEKQQARQRLLEFIKTSPARMMDEGMNAEVAERVAEEVADKVGEEIGEFEEQNPPVDLAPNTNGTGNSNSNTNGATASLRVPKDDFKSPNDGRFQKEFENLWKSYPKKKGKDSALKAYIRARRSGTAKETIEKALQAFNEEIQLKRTAMQYIPYGSTWFNQKRWEDDYETRKTFEPPTGSLGEWEHSWGM